MSSLKVSQADHLRDIILHTYTDMRVAFNMLRRWRLIAAWRHLQQGYNRLGKALDTKEAA